jgi:hypothetical protein
MPDTHTPAMPLRPKFWAVPEPTVEDLNALRLARTACARYVETLQRFPWRYECAATVSAELHLQDMQADLETLKAAEAEVMAALTESAR